MKILYGFLIGAAVGGGICGLFAGVAWVLPRLENAVGSAWTVTILLMLSFGAVGAVYAIGSQPKDDI